MPIAGPVFTEWYWGPIFFAIVYGPPILAAAGVLYGLGGRLTPWRRRTRAAAALLAAPVLVLGTVAVVTTLRYQRAETAQARAVTFATFEADALHQTRSAVYDGLQPSLHFTYEREGRLLFASQHAARGDDVTPPACAVHTGTRFSSWDGPCSAARTPDGQVVTLARTPDPSLLAVRDGTLIVARSYEALEADLLAYADALEPVDTEDVHWER